MLAGSKNATGSVHEHTMRSADEPRVCQYSRPDEPSKICEERLHGRGRWKWCAIHSAIVRNKQNNARVAQRQRDWRARHPVKYKNQKSVYQMVDKIQLEILDNFPKAPATPIWESVPASALADVKEAFKEAGGICHEGKAGTRTPAITNLNGKWIRLTKTGALLSRRYGRYEVFFMLPKRKCVFVGFGETLTSDSRLYARVLSALLKGLPLAKIDIDLETH